MPTLDSQQVHFMTGYPAYRANRGWLDSGRLRHCLSQGWIALALAMAYPIQAAATQGQVIFVDDSAAGQSNGSSWADAFVNLQDALAMAQAGDQVWVAVGTYRADQGQGLSTGDVNASFRLPSGVALLGGFAGYELSLEQRSGLFDWTVLDGFLQSGTTPAAELRSQHVLRAEGVAAGTRLSGFTIANGLAKDFPRGAGILWVGSGEIADCIVRDNRVTAAPDKGDLGGAGLYFAGDGRVERCRFENNSVHTNGTLTGPDQGLRSGGGAALLAGSIELVDCRFEANLCGQLIRNQFGSVWAYSRGGAVAAFGPVALRGCEFESNHSYGLLFPGGLGSMASGAPAYGGAVFGEGPLLIEGCTFRFNQAQGGYGVDSPQHFTYAGSGGSGYGGAVACSGTLRSCLFESNVASGGSGGDNWTAEFAGYGGNAYGGAIYGGVSASGLTMRNNQANGGDSMDLSFDATGYGAGLYMPSGTATLIRGSILWGNRTKPVAGLLTQQVGGQLPPLFEFSCIEGWTPSSAGLGNLGLDPLFVGPLDSSLQANSPCIDTGNNLAFGPEVSADAAGHWRFLEDASAPDLGQSGGVGGTAIADMGALEFGSFFTPGLDLSLAQGGTRELTLDAGLDRAHQLYWIAGSLSGTVPGTPIGIGGALWPLAPDIYLSLMTTQPSPAWLPASVGLLDHQGRAVAQFLLPPGSVPALAGQTVHHAFAAFDLSPGPAATWVSNPAPLRLEP